MRLPELQPVRTVAEGWKLVARMEKMGGYIDQETANLRRGLAAGKVATAEEIGRVLGQLDELLAKPDDKWPLRAPAAAPHADWPAPERSRSARGRRRARRRHPPGLRALPRARCGGDPAARARRGARRHPQHRRRRRVLRQLVKVHTSLEFSAAEIHRSGSRSSRASRPRWRASASRRSARARCPICGAAARRPGGVLRARGEIETAARKALARAQAAEPRFLGRRPRTPCVVKRIDAFEEKDAPIAYYRPAAIDGSGPAAYYVNTYKPETRARYEVEALAFHESVPGHHIQIAIAQEVTGLPEFRKHAGVTAFVEGWGLYAEGLADELGLYKGAARAAGPVELRCVARQPVGRRHRDSRDGLEPIEGDRVLRGERHPRQGQHHQRGRSLHRVAGPGARLQGRRTRDSTPAGRRREAAGAKVRREGVPRSAAGGRRGEPARAARADRRVDRESGAAH